MRYVITAESLVKVGFSVLAVLFLCNINGVIYLIFGVEAPLSPIILGVAGIIIATSLFQLQLRMSSISLNLLLVFFVVYLSFGSVIVLYDLSYLTQDFSIYELFRHYVPSTLVILSAYFGTRVYLLTGTLDRLLRLLIVLSVITASFTVLAPYIGLTEAYSFARYAVKQGERQVGLFANPNEAGAFGTYLLVLLLAGYGYFKRYSWVCLALIPLALYSVFLSFSKASLIFSVLILVVYVVFNVKNFFAFKAVQPAKSLVFTTILVSGIIFVVSNFLTYTESLSLAQRTRLFQTFSLLSGDFNEKTTSERSYLYDYAFEEIKQRPLTGYGLGTYHRINFRGLYKSIGVHNTHLMIIGETGILIYLIFFMAHLSLGWKGWVHVQPALGFLIVGIVLVYFINISGAGHNGLYNRPSNVFIGIACALSQYRPKTLN